jgi:hypothetical protein
MAQIRHRLRRDFVRSSRIASERLLSSWLDLYILNIVALFFTRNINFLEFFLSHLIYTSGIHNIIIRSEVGVVIRKFILISLEPIQLFHQMHTIFELMRRNSVFGVMEWSISWSSVRLSKLQIIIHLKMFWKRHIILLKRKIEILGNSSLLFSPLYRPRVIGFLNSDYMRWLSRLLLVCGLQKYILPNLTLSLFQLSILAQRRVMDLWWQWKKSLTF